MNVVVVDDDQITLELVKHILDEIVVGEVKPFSSSIAAMEYLRDVNINQLDLVICDRHMPDFSGFDILHAIRIRSQKVPFLMLTGDATRESVVNAIREGATDFIAKPFKNKDLTDKVSRLLQPS